MKTLYAITFCCIATGGVADHEFEGRALDTGRALYDQNCATCHGANLEGQPNWQRADENGVLPAPPHDDTGHTWHHDSQYLFYYTKLGGQAVMDQMGVENFTSAMPAFQETLSDEEILDILAYIHSTWSPQMQDFQAQRTHN